MSFLDWWSILTFAFVCFLRDEDVSSVTKCEACLFPTQISKCNIDTLKHSYVLDDFMLSTFLVSACWIWNSMKGKLCSCKFCTKWMMFTQVTWGLFRLFWELDAELCMFTTWYIFTPLISALYRSVLNLHLQVDILNCKENLLCLLL